MGLIKISLKKIEKIDFLFPNNIATALSGNVVLPVIVLALFISIAIIVENRRHPERTKPFINFNNSLNTIITRVTKFVLKLTPYAVFAFMAFAVGRSNGETLKQLGLYVVLIYGSMLFHFIFVQMLLLKIMKLSPIQFIKKISPAMFLAFTSQSSYGTLPVTMESLTKRVGVSDRIANFVGPLSANVGMNACGGIFPAMVAVLTANAYGIHLGVVEFILLLVVTTVSAIGIAGVPGISTIAAAVVLSLLGLPIEGIALVIAVDTDINDAQMLGIQSVPTFVVNREFGVSGAQKEEYFLNMLHDTYNKMHPTKLNITDDGSACGPDGCDI